MNPGRLQHLFLLIAALLLSGCTLEQKLARQYVKMPRPGPMLVMHPTAVLKYNLKTFEVPDIDSLDPIEREAQLFNRSLFLKEIQDSVLINLFSKKFEGVMEETGWTVLYENSLDSLMAAGAAATIVNLAQFTLEEFIHPFRAEEEVYGEIIVIDGIDLNALNFNVWLEVSHLNGERKNELLFSSDYLHDDINGTLKQNLVTGQYGFDYTLDTMDNLDIYSFAGIFAEKTAEKLFDHLMNSFILENLPEDYPYELYYHHYDRKKRLVYPIDPEEAIIPVKE